MKDHIFVVVLDWLKWHLVGFQIFLAQTSHCFNCPKGYMCTGSQHAAHYGIGKMKKDISTMLDLSDTSLILCQVTELYSCWNDMTEIIIKVCKKQFNQLLNCSKGCPVVRSWQIPCTRMISFLTLWGKIGKQFWWEISLIVKCYVTSKWPLKVHVVVAEILAV